MSSSVKKQKLNDDKGQKQKRLCIKKIRSCKKVRYVGIFCYSKIRTRGNANSTLASGSQTKE